MEEETLDMFEGWQPIVIEDENVDFSKPIKGRYDAQITDIEYSQVNVGESSKDTIRIKTKITNDVSGDKSFNRFMDKTFWMGRSEQYPDSKPGEVQLMDTVCATGLDVPIDTLKTLLKEKSYSSVVEELLKAIKDKTVRLSCYVGKTGKQVTRFVKAKKEEGQGLSALGF